jgi:hypothetical protein
MTKFLFTRHYSLFDIVAYSAIFALSQLNLWFLLLIIPFGILAVTLERKVNV